MMPKHLKDAQTQAKLCLPQAQTCRTQAKFCPNSAQKSPKKLKFSASGTVLDIIFGTGHYLWTAIAGGWNALLHKITLNQLKGGKNQAILHYYL